MQESVPSRGGVWTWAALVAAVVVLGGSLYLSMGMGLIACTLCFYQRTFVMAVVGVLAVGLLTGLGRGSSLSLLALPAAVGGIGVAAFHVYLELNGTLECPLGVQGIGTAPKQSLAAFAVLLIMLLLDVFAGRGEGSRMPALGLGIVLGVLFTWGAIAGSPKPKIPTEPYKDPLNTCRVPYGKFTP